MKTREPLRTELVRTLGILAAAPEDQLAHLKMIGCAQCVDELALEVDDVLPEGVSVEGLALTKEQLGGIQAVQAELGAMSGPQHEELWQPAALSTRQEWKQLRKAASRAIALLN
jgi:hypothetical protein